MITVGLASEEDLDRLVELEASLFREDAGRHDRYADVSWPLREGRADFERLVHNSSSLVLRASVGDSIVGHLVGYLAKSSPTRQPVTYAILRSVYVESQHRSNGIGRLLTERFVAWARLNGCAEAHVDSYSANTGAQRFYERIGFTAQSVSRTMPLE